MGILIYLMVALLNIILISTIALSVSKSGHFNVFNGPYGFIPATALGLSIILCIFTVYSLITLNKTNQRLTEEFIQPNKQNGQGTSPLKDRLSKNEEKRLKSSGQLVMKWKLGWMYSPDRLEEWLEGMEEKGYNLYSVGKTGTAFYFKKGSLVRCVIVRTYKILLIPITSTFIRILAGYVCINRVHGVRNGFYGAKNMYQVKSNRKYTAIS